MMGKRLRDWTKADIDALISEEVLEGDEIEFKSDLPAKKGSRTASWWDGSDVSDKALNEVIEEVIAFANGHGGTVFIGIAESDSKPARAISVEPLP